MRIYISGRISGLDLGFAKTLFQDGERKAAIFFGQFSNEVITVNPMMKVSEGEYKTYNDYMREDIKLLMDCAGIWMLRNWKESKGARFEHYIAKWLNLAIGYEND